MESMGTVSRIMGLSAQKGGLVGGSSAIFLLFPRHSRLRSQCEWKGKSYQGMESCQEKQSINTDWVFIELPVNCLWIRTYDGAKFILSLRAWTQ